MKPQTASGKLGGAGKDGNALLGDYVLFYDFNGSCLAFLLRACDIE